MRSLGLEATYFLQHVFEFWFLKNKSNIWSAAWPEVSIPWVTDASISCKLILTLSSHFSLVSNISDILFHIHFCCWSFLIIIIIHLFTKYLLTSNSPLFDSTFWYSFIVSHASLNPFSSIEETLKTHGFHVLYAGWINDKALLYSFCAVFAACSKAPFDHLSKTSCYRLIYWWWSYPLALRYLFWFPFIMVE